MIKRADFDDQAGSFQCFLLVKFNILLDGKGEMVAGPDSVCSWAKNVRFQAERQ